MADKRISELPAATTPLDGTELLAVVQGGVTSKATAQDVADLASGGGSTPIIFVVSLQGDLNISADGSDFGIFTANGTFVPSTDITFVDEVPDVSNGKFVVNTAGVYKVSVTFTIFPNAGWPGDMTKVTVALNGSQVATTHRGDPGSGNDSYEPTVTLSGFAILNSAEGDEIFPTVSVFSYGEPSTEFQVLSMFVMFEKIGDYIPPG